MRAMKQPQKRILSCRLFMDGLNTPDRRKTVNGKNSKACREFYFHGLNHALDLTVLLGKIARPKIIFMSRPVTLFTGQWADLPLAELLPLGKKMGYDGVELACWGDHFEVDRAMAEPDYVKKKWALLSRHGLSCYAISSHLVGQAVCDLIDERHKAILSADVWGDGKPEGVRRRAAKKMMLTAKAARAFFDAK